KATSAVGEEREAAARCTRSVARGDRAAGRVRDARGVAAGALRRRADVRVRDRRARPARLFAAIPARGDPGGGRLRGAAALLRRGARATAGGARDRAAAAA